MTLISVSDGNAALLSGEFVADLGGPFASPSNLTAMGDSLYYAKYESATGTELWKWNTTTSLQSGLTDIWPGTGSSSPGQLKPVNGLLWFSATDAYWYSQNPNGHGTELWYSDGQPGEERLVADINPGVQSGSYHSSDPWKILDVNGVPYFQAINQNTGIQLYRAPSLTSVERLTTWSYLDWGGTGKAAVVGDRLFFGSGGLWTINAAESTPTRLTNEYVATNYLTEVDGTLYFQGVDGSNVGLGNSLYRWSNTDGVQIILFGGNTDVSPYYLTNVNGTLFFSARDSIHGRELWYITPGSAPQILEILPGTSSGLPLSANPRNFVASGSRLFFTADSPNGTVLYSVDGSNPAPTLTPLSPEIWSSWNTAASVNGHIVWSTFSELWSSDGTPMGTGTVTMPSQYYLTSGTQFAVVDGTIWTVSGSGLFRIDVGLPGDFDDNGIVDARDIDILWQIVRGSGTDPGSNDTADLNGSGLVNEDDVDFILANLLSAGPNRRYGDANLSGGSPELTDYNLWRTGTGGWAGGDFDGSGGVPELNDYNLWRTGPTQFPGIVGAHGEGGGPLVPEPSSLLLLATGGAIFALCRWRKAKRRKGFWSRKS